MFILGDKYTWSVDYGISKWRRYNSLEDDVYKTKKYPGILTMRPQSNSIPVPPVCVNVNRKPTLPPFACLTLCGVRVRAGDTLASMGSTGGGPVGLAEAGVSRLSRSSAARSMAYLWVSPDDAAQKGEDSSYQRRPECSLHGECRSSESPRLLVITIYHWHSGGIIQA